ncbi:MAG: AsmA family protein, partial [Bacteroidales bacterium]
MKKLLRLVIIILITVTLLLLMGSALVVFILSPSRLTPLVNKYANQFLNAYVHVEEVSVQPLKNFPHISLILKNGILLVPDAEQDTDKTDTLVAFRQLRAVLQPVSLLKNHLHLSRLSLEKATVRLYKNKDGIANWAIFPESEDTLSSGFSFSIGRLTVRDTLHVTFDNREDSLFFQTNIGNMAVRTSRRHSGYHTRIDSYSNTLITGKTRFLDHIPFLINGNITFDSNFDKFLFTDCQGTLDEVPYYLNMSLEMHPDSLELHGTLRLDTVLVTRLLHACPPFLLPEKNLSFSSFQTSFTASYNPREKNLGTLQLHTLDLKSRELELQAGGKLLSYTNDPLLDLSAKALIHAENLSAFIQDEPEHNMQGSVSMDIQARGKIRDLNPEGLKNIQLLSHISTPGFTLDLPRNNIFCKADSTELYLNISETKPLTGSLKTKRLQLVLSDSTRLHLQRGDVSLTMNSHEPDPGIPFMHLQLNARSAGGVYGIHRGTLRGLKIQAAVTQTPERQRRTATTDTTRRRTADSTRQRNVADTTRRRTAFAGNFMPRRTRHEFSFADLQFNFGFTPETRELLRKWQVNGTLQTTSAQVITPIYPLRTRLHSVHLELQDNLLKIHNMSIKSGHSDLRLSGQLNGIRRALTGKAQLNLYLEIQGDTLEGNELLHAIAAGTEILSQQDSAGLKQLRKAAASESDTQLEHIITQAAVERKAYEDLIIIPGNVNMQVILQVSNAYYRHLHLQDVSGSLLATD